MTTGGPAFPSHRTGESIGQGNRTWYAHEPITGMTLLDYFAAKALSGIIAAENSPAGDWDRCAAHAYEAAAAMLAEKARREGAAQ